MVERCTLRSLETSSKVIILDVWVNSFILSEFRQKVGVFGRTQNGGRPIKEVELETDSPRRTFYILRLEKISAGHPVSRKSDSNGRVFHRQDWFRQSLDGADIL